MIDEITIELCFCKNCGKDLIEIPYNKEFDDIVQRDLENAYKHDMDLLISECVKAIEEDYNKRNRDK